MYPVFQKITKDTSVTQTSRRRLRAEFIDYVADYYILLVFEYAVGGDLDGQKLRELFLTQGPYCIPLLVCLYQTINPKLIDSFEQDPRSVWASNSQR
jgi:hypothetical protein